MLDESKKKMLRTYGIIFLLLSAFTGILIPFIILNRKTWNDGLAKQVQTVINDSRPASYTVDTPVKINSLFSTSGAAYSLKAVKDGIKTPAYGIILRIPTLYGPQPGVFLYTENEETVFLGFAIPEGKVTENLSHFSTDARINYWCKKIPSIIAGSGDKQ